MHFSTDILTVACRERWLPTFFRVAITLNFVFFLFVASVDSPFRMRISLCLWKLMAPHIRCTCWSGHTLMNSWKRWANCMNVFSSLHPWRNTPTQSLTYSISKEDLYLFIIRCGFAMIKCCQTAVSRCISRRLTHLCLLLWLMHTKLCNYGSWICSWCFHYLARLRLFHLVIRTCFIVFVFSRWNVFRARLFRESCVYHRGNYVKDLNKLGRDLQKIVIVDNSPASYIFHPDNAVIS